MISMNRKGTRAPPDLIFRENGSTGAPPRTAKHKGGAAAPIGVILL